MPECPPGTHSMFDFCPGDCNEPLSAREMLADYDVPEDVIDGVLCVHAHELAEQIRTEVAPIAVFRSEEMRALAKYGRRLADIIDPEVP